MRWDLWVGCASGLYLVNPNMDPGALLPTLAVVHVSDAVLCRVIAHHAGRPRDRWTLWGLVGGIWAVLILLLLPPPRR